MLIRIIDGRFKDFVVDHPEGAETFDLSYDEAVNPPKFTTHKITYHIHDLRHISGEVVASTSPNLIAFNTE
jgi:hypothetical protein